MPALEPSGDPAAVVAAAEAWARAARSHLQSADHMLATMPGEQVWRGDAGEASRTVLAAEAERLRDSAAALDAGALSLHGYAGVLGPAQARRDAARRTYDAAASLYAEQARNLRSAPPVPQAVAQRLAVMSRTRRTAESALAAHGQAQEQVDAAARRLELELREASRTFAAPVSARVRTGAGTTPASASQDVHVVRPGDSLWSIAAARLGEGGAWQQIARLNHLDESQRLRPGQRLVMPAVPATPRGRAPGPATRDHLVRPGDTLWGISRDEYGDGRRYPQVADATRGVRQPDGRSLKNPDRIYAGWHVRVPEATADATLPLPPVPPAPTPRPAALADPATPDAATPQEPAPATPDRGVIPDPAVTGTTTPVPSPPEETTQGRVPSSEEHGTDVTATNQGAAVGDTGARNPLASDGFTLGGKLPAQLLRPLPYVGPVARALPVGTFVAAEIGHNGTTGYDTLTLGLGYGPSQTRVDLYKTVPPNATAAGLTFRLSGVQSVNTGPVASEGKISGLVSIGEDGATGAVSLGGQVAAAPGMMGNVSVGTAQGLFYDTEGYKLRGFSLKRTRMTPLPSWYVSGTVTLTVPHGLVGWMSSVGKGRATPDDQQLWLPPGP